MRAKEQRDYLFDTWRGILVIAIVISHFTKISGSLYADIYIGTGFVKESLGGVIYILIMGTTMQAFTFISGYFSKNTERARETAFKTFMLPYLIFSLIYFGIRHFFFGNAHLNFLVPSFGLWFLFVLFFYRIIIKSVANYKWLLPVSIIIFLLAGQVPDFNGYFEVKRLLSFFPYFLIGYYCSKERVEWIKKLRRKPFILVIMGTTLVGSSIMLAMYGPDIIWYLLRESTYEIVWYEDIFWRIISLLLCLSWMIFMINILPSSKNLFSYVGRNTMPVYTFHMVLRYVIKFYGLYIGFISCLIVVWFGILSLIHKRVKNTELYVASIVLSLAAFSFMYASGILSFTYNLCPENKVIYYILVYGGALISGFSFVCPFWIKLYDIIVNGVKYMFKRITIRERIIYRANNEQ